MKTRRIVGLAEEALTHSIIGGFYEAYRELGFGFLESVYVEALARELRSRGHRVERGVMIKVWYKGDVIARHRIDMLVDGKVVVEVKAGITLPVAGSRQLRNYLRGSDKEVGLLLHFGPEPRHVREYVPNTSKDQGAALSAHSALVRVPPQPLHLAEAPVEDAPE